MDDFEFIIYLPRSICSFIYLKLRIFQNLTSFTRNIIIFYSDNYYYNSLKCRYENLADHEFIETSNNFTKLQASRKNPKTISLEDVTNDKPKNSIDSHVFVFITSVDAVTVMLDGRLRRETQCTDWKLKLEPMNPTLRVYRGTIQPAGLI